MTGGSGGAGGNGSDDSSDSGGNGAGNGSSGNNEDSANPQGGGNDSGGGGGGGGSSGSGGSGGNSGSGGGDGNGGGGSGSGSFADKGLQAHNMFRKIHGSPSMKLDNQMSKDAEEYAKKLASMGTLQHSGREARKGAGENLAMKCSSRKEDLMTAEEATKNWLVIIINECLFFSSMLSFVSLFVLMLA